jgi:glycosyltransferase involved in cell wall biosynthesis
MKEGKRKTILYFFVGHSTFVQKDIDIFSKEFAVKTFNFKADKKWETPFLFIKQKLFLLRNIWSANLVVCQFAGYHSFLPCLIARIFSKPSLVISGGMDCHNFPSIGYGNLNRPFVKTFTRWSFKLCTHIAPKHESLWMCDYTYEDQDYPKQGVKYFMPKLNKPHTAIENGYDSEKLYRRKEKKPDTFLTVAGGFRYSSTVALKGIDLVLEIAKQFPQCTFTIVGVEPGISLPLQSSNVILVPPVKNEALIDYFSESQFYLQLSMAEGFPNALCEAMLCECIPIGSNVFSIPEIIDGTGLILKRRNADDLIKVIEQALMSNKEKLSKAARKQVVVNYSLSSRENKLSSLLKKLLSNSN